MRNTYLMGTDILGGNSAGESESFLTARLDYIPGWCWLVGAGLGVWYAMNVRKTGKWTFWQKSLASAQG